MLPAKLLFSSIGGGASQLRMRDCPSSIVAIELGVRSLVYNIAVHNAAMDV